LKTTTRLATGLLALCAALGLYVLGRATAGHGSDDRGRAAGYARGLADGRAQGERDGRAGTAVSGVPAGERAPAKAAYESGYQAGANAVFTGYDGGWSYATPYIVTLARGDVGITYRIASRTPLHPGVDYHLCADAATLCQAPRR
jgi:hypothetical protein